MELFVTSDEMPSQKTAQ